MTDQMQELLTLVSVDRVSMTRDRSSLRVYIISPRLIDKRNIWSLEKGIREQLFPGKQIQIHIFEKYTLSEQYTPEKLLTAYRDSLQAELKEYSIVEYSIFRKGTCTFPKPDLLHMTVEDTMVNRDKAGELKRVLEKVFHERCGLPVEVEYEYVPPVRAKASIQRELQAQQEAERMTAKVAAVLGLSEATGTDGAFAEAKCRSWRWCRGSCFGRRPEEGKWKVWRCRKSRYCCENRRKCSEWIYRRRGQTWAAAFRRQKGV